MPVSFDTGELGDVVDVFGASLVKEYWGLEALLALRPTRLRMLFDREGSCDFDGSAS